MNQHFLVVALCSLCDERWTCARMRYCAQLLRYCREHAHLTIHLSNFSAGEHLTEEVFCHILIANLVQQSGKVCFCSVQVCVRGC